MDMIHPAHHRRAVSAHLCVLGPVAGVSPGSYSIRDRTGWGEDPEVGWSEAGLEEKRGYSQGALSPCGILGEGAEGAPYRCELHTYEGK